MEKPIHVRVAEALGITIMFDDSEGWTYFPGEFKDGRKPVPSYDTDWSATGPLIEKYKIGLDYRDAGWAASVFYPPLNLPEEVAFGSTPLVAVCNLILALKEAGKLEPK